MHTGDSWFARRFSDLRKSKDLNQAHVATEMKRRGFTGFLQTTVGKIERGERRVTVGEAAALADIVGVKLSALISDAKGDDLSSAFETAGATARVLERAATDHSRALLDVAVEADRAGALSAAELRWLNSELVNQSPGSAVIDAAIALSARLELDKVDGSGNYVSKLLEVVNTDADLLTENHRQLRTDDADGDD